MTAEESTMEDRSTENNRVRQNICAKRLSASLNPETLKPTLLIHHRARGYEMEYDAQLDDSEASGGYVAGSWR